MIIRKAAWICIENHRVLMARSKGKTLFYIPGGKVENNESELNALIREIREELNVDLIPNSLRPFGSFEAPADGQPEGTIVKISCYLAGYKGKVKAGNEIEEVAWLGSGDKDKTSAVDHKILDALKEKNKIT